MKTKFDKVLYSYIEENITIDPKRLTKDLERVSQSLPDQSKRALETTSQALAGATETDPIEAEFLKLAKYKDISDEEKLKIIMNLIDKKALPDVTQNYQKEKETEEDTNPEKQKTNQSSLTYSSPSFQ